MQKLVERYDSHFVSKIRPAVFTNRVYSLYKTLKGVKLRRTSLMKEWPSESRELDYLSKNRIRRCLRCFIQLTKKRLILF